MRKTAVIAGISAVVLLSAGIAALMLWPEPTHEPEPPPEAPVRDIGDMVRESREDIARVIFKPAAGDEYILHYDHEEDELTLETTHTIFEGEQATMQSIFSRTILLTSLTRITEEADNAQLTGFGLNNPTMVIRVERLDGTYYEFMVGDMQAAGQGRYTRMVGSNEVFLLTSVQGAILTLDAEDVYDISYLPYEEFHDIEIFMQVIEHVTMEREDDTIEFRKRTEEDWESAPFGASAFQILQPFTAEANDTMIQNVLIEDIITIMPDTIEAIRPTNLSQYGLDNPVRLTVTAWDWTGTLLIGSRDIERDGRFVMIEGHDAVLLDTAGKYSFLNTSPVQLRSSIIWLYNINEMASVEFLLDGEIRLLEFEHIDETTLRGWLDGTEISETNARRLYMAALMIMQTGITTDPIPANASPMYAITMNLSDGKSDKLELYQLNDSQFLITHNGVNIELFTTRMSLQQNILSRFEIIDAGGDIPIT